VLIGADSSSRLLTRAALKQAQNVLMLRDFPDNSSRDSRQAIAVKAWLIEREPGEGLSLERVWKGVYGAWAGCQGRRPGWGARRRAMRPIMAHLTMASEWMGRRS
jgi:hypothetical protein